MEQKTNETVSTREQALSYWKFLPSGEKLRLWREYQKTTFTPSNSPDDLTSREIEEIWRKQTKQVGFIGGESLALSVGLKPSQKQYSQEEVDRLLDQQTARTTAQILENKKRQFKKFDETLFKAYIDKFSYEQKLKALKVLSKSLKQTR